MTATVARPNSLPISAVFTDTGTLAARHLIRLWRTPQLLVAGLTSPVLFMVLLRYVFGGAIVIPGMTYADYLVPAMLIQNIVFSGLASAAALATDAREGTVDRFRSLPMAHVAVLSGRAVSDVLVQFVAIWLTLGAGLLVGFRFHSSATESIDADRLEGASQQKLAGPLAWRHPTDFRPRRQGSGRWHS